MLLKVSKTTPRCPKRLPGYENTEKSRLSGGDFTEESLNSPVMNTPGSRHLRVLGTSIRAG
jgi:hypothetical protein